MDNPADNNTKFINQFIKFCKSNFDKKSFPKWFYRELSNMFGLVALCDQEGFYNYFFRNEETKKSFLQYIIYDQTFSTTTEKFIINWIKASYNIK